MIERCVDLDRFVRGELDIAGFSHHEHLRLGLERLRRHDFAEADFVFHRRCASWLLSAASGDWTTRFLQYDASTLMIILLDARLRNPASEDACERRYAC